MRQKRVDILYFGRVNAKTGVSTVLKSFVKGTAYLQNNNILLKIFDLDGEYLDSQKGNNNEIGFQPSFKSNLKRIAKKNFFISWFLVYRLYWFNAKKSLKFYLKKNRSADVMFFHDFFSCYLYLKLNLKIKQKKY
ncbi:hypothetical protein BST83_12175 [Polaribacter filamentus]|uniref:Uncharacterized protein n=1 Tax=Polaribacter filamentus TaxID=53483 RepID=A0A2S7KYT4_9FLAO|nr:hypothetical protein [Polaribacter filamentus]PQB07825.1 hypothetical protein BST83_12175 [Polaribacter filamentus]